ncbi:hypothetical protein EVAR_3463_1 [Eumeta japonica]|uniref:Uncharacterized protein n=1 Tax=Eumeta variegata TaxID=151549 RepID=A0A4C1SSK1_EUMVA|nr:hypothetical protein EVAR_3463_1 [Eumeta japonica]
MLYFSTATTDISAAWLMIDSNKRVTYQQIRTNLGIATFKTWRRDAVPCRKGVRWRRRRYLISALRRALLPFARVARNTKLLVPRVVIIASPTAAGASRGRFDCGISSTITSPLQAPRPTLERGCLELTPPRCSSAGWWRLLLLNTLLNCELLICQLERTPASSISADFAINSARDHGHILDVSSGPIVESGPCPALD